MEQAAYLANGGEEAASVGGLVVAPCQCARVRYRCGPRIGLGRAAAGATRLSARGVAWGPRTRARRWRRPTSGEVAATSSVWRAEWRGSRGRGIGEEHKKEDGTGIYMPCPFTLGAIPPSRVKVLYSRCVLPTGSKGIPLVPVGNTHRE